MPAKSEMDWSDRSKVLEQVRRSAAYGQDPPLKKAVSFQDDHEIVLEAVKRHADSLQFASPELKSNPDIVLAAIARDVKALKYSPLHNDANFIIRAVTPVADAMRPPGYYPRRHFIDYKLVSERLLSDASFIEKIIHIDPNIFAVAHSTIQANQEIAKLAISGNARNFAVAHSTIQANQEIAKLAISGNAAMLVYAHEQLRENRELIAIAMKEWPGAVKYAGPRLGYQNDRSVVLAALAKDDCGCDFAYQAYQESGRFRCRPVGDDESIECTNYLQSLPGEMQADREIVLTAVKHHWPAIQHAPPHFRKDKEVVLTAVQSEDTDCVRTGWQALKFADARLLADREIIMAAVGVHGLALQYAAPPLQADCDIVRASVIPEAKEANQCFERDMHLASRIFAYAAAEVKNNYRFVLEVVGSQGMCLEHASSNLRDDFEVVLAAVASIDDALQFASKYLQDLFNSTFQQQRSRGSYLSSGNKAASIKELLAKAPQRKAALENLQIQRKAGVDAVAFGRALQQATDVVVDPRLLSRATMEFKCMDRLTKCNLPNELGMIIEEGQGLGLHGNLMNEANEKLLKLQGLSTFLRKLGMADYARVLTDNDCINVGLLKACTEADFQKMGLQQFQAKNLKMAVASAIVDPYGHHDANMMRPPAPTKCETTGCDRPPAAGFKTCCRTCIYTKSARHGPTCIADAPAQAASAYTMFCCHTKKSKRWNCSDFVRDHLWDFLDRHQVVAFFDEAHLPGGTIDMCVQEAKSAQVLLVVLDDEAPSQWMVREVSAAISSGVKVQTVYRSDIFNWDEVGKDAWWRKRGSLNTLTPEVIQAVFATPAVAFNCQPRYLRTARRDFLTVLDLLRGVDP